MNLVYWLISREFPKHILDEDIRQTGMVGLCMAADKWDESRGTFSNFAYPCIKNAIINEFRRRKKHYHVISSDYDILGDDGTRIPLIETIMGDEDVLYIDDCEDKLGPQQKVVLNLLKKGVRPRDVAKILGITPQRVYQIQRRLRLLRKFEGKV